MKCFAATHKGNRSFRNHLKKLPMKKFELKAKGSLTQYIKDNAIKAKGEISNVMLLGPADASCWYFGAPEASKGLSVSL